MKAPKDSCIQIVNHSVIKIEEKRAVARFSNPSRKSISRVSVDACEMLGSTDIRCDFLVCSEDRINFVELKGGDVGHALAQIEESITYFGISREESREVFAYIVCRNVNPAFSTSIQNASRRLLRCNAVRLVVKNSPLDAPVDGT